MKSQFALTTGMAIILCAALFITGGPAPARAAEPVKHIVLLDDDLHLLAAYYYRDPRQYKAIVAANRHRKEVDGHPSILAPGAVILIPAENLKPFPTPYAEWRQKVR